jgi:polysaccharide export outer membrane protein
MPEYVKTEFQRYVQSSVGVELPIFGHEFFEDVPTTFAPVDRVPVQADYVIGPGDQLLIRAWGKIDLDSRVYVDRTGQIYLPRVGAITVAGVRYDRLNSVIHSAIGRFFKDFDVNVNVGQLRSIQVFVLGYARRPGTYTVSSLSTLMNALFESGGPASNGSMRHVQLKRNNAVVTDLDLYDLILKGDKSRDANLQSGDVIYIPRVGAQVAVSGSVHRSAIYELRQPDRLGDIVEDAGGLTSVAGTKRVSLERVRQHTERLFDEFALDSASLQRELSDGDIVRIYPISPRIGNAVTLRGNVAQPGRYLWHEGMRVSDLIPSRDALVTRQYWNARNNIVRPGKYDDFSTPSSRGSSSSREPSKDRPESQPGAAETQDAQQKRDDTQRAQEDLLGREGRIGIKQDTAADVSSTETKTQPNEDLAADIRRRASDINWEYAVVERTDEHDLTTQLVPFNLGNAIDQPSSNDNQRLLPGDVVTVFSQLDIPVSTETRAKFVQVEGEVKAPGLYRVDPNETLRDVVRRAGGLSSHAYLYGAELHRESTLKLQKIRLAQMVERMQRELGERLASPASLSAEDRNEERLRIQEQRDFVTKLAQVKPTGRVVLELRPSDSTLENIPAMALEDGDKLFVPAKLDTIEVFGAVYNENAFRFKRGKPIPEYLSNAGGFTRGADKGREFVIRADGTVVSRQQSRGFLYNRFESLRLMPGDAIVVPERFKTGGFMRGLRDWTQIFSGLALGAGAINILR